MTEPTPSVTIVRLASAIVALTEHVTGERLRRERT
jgi:hypothetical protein